jgi:hypothetical protein
MTTYRKGQTLFTIGFEPDGKPTTETWIIRTIRGGKITAIWKLSHTWGKRSKKQGDFGWLDPIPAWCRNTWREDRPIPSWFMLFTTKRQAIRHFIKTHDPEDFDTPEQAERALIGLNRMKP